MIQKLSINQNNRLSFSGKYEYFKKGIQDLKKEVNIFDLKKQINNFNTNTNSTKTLPDLYTDVESLQSRIQNQEAINAFFKNTISQEEKENNTYKELMLWNLSALPLLFVIPKSKTKEKEQS